MMTRWTKSKARLTLIRTQPGGNYNWLFLPGGPGLGSESLKGLTDLLHLPGTIWHLDLPGDGSNRIVDDVEAFSNWSEALIEATTALDDVILVGHSLGGMFALATPELASHLEGLVLIASAPDASFQESFAVYVTNNPLPNTRPLEIQYETNPDDEIFKELTIAYAPYMATDSGKKAIVTLMEGLPFNYRPYRWTGKNFNPIYKAKWVPKNIPVLVMAGDKDYLTPLKLFRDLPEYQGENVLMREIPGASHFPWLENPERVRKVFEEYVLSLR
jgi:pimeloyl-ACP methyl ester carboxylesterase